MSADPETRVAVTRRRCRRDADPAMTPVPDRRPADLRAADGTVLIDGRVRKPVYRFGHLGVSMLVYAPIGAGLALVGEVGLAVVAGAVMLWLSMLPDVDHRLPLIEHRGPTHSLLFAGLVGAAFAAVAVALAPDLGVGGRLTSGTFGFLLGAVTVLAHLLADALTPSGVDFLWPVSRRSYTLSLWRADDTVANYALLVLGAGVLAATVAALSRAGVI